MDNPTKTERIVPMVGKGEQPVKEDQEMVEGSNSLA
jgi:hypothetical protein